MLAGVSLFAVGLLGADDQPPAAPEPAPAARPAPRPIKRLGNPYLRLPAVTPSPAASAAEPAAAEGGTKQSILVLPKITVTDRKDQSSALPRLYTKAPVKDLPAQKWETPEARLARLVQKHFTFLERRLGSPLALAREAEQREAAEAAVLQLNSVADLLKLGALAGLDDPEEQKKLRALYFQTLAERPR